MYHDVGPQIEVEIDLGSTRMRVRRHRVPDTARFELGEAHHELATFDSFGMNIFRDAAQVALLRVPDGIRVSLRAGRMRRRIRHVSRRTDKIELSLTAGTVFEGDVAFALPDVETVQRVHLVPRAAHTNDTGCPYIDDADFATFEKEVGTRGFAAGQKEWRGTRHRSTGDHAVEVRVVGGHLAGLEE